jgi:2TM domain
MGHEQRYERAHARVQALKGFYIHATVFVLVNIGLFVITCLRRERGGSTGRSYSGA